MKPWFLGERERRPAEVMRDMMKAGQAILEASDDLPECEDLILFDLETDVATRFVAMPVYHRHDQDCGRA